MASDSGALPDTGAVGDLRMQNISMMGPDGELFSIPLPEITEINLNLARTSILYASQVGACFILLVVVLTTTPKHRFARIPTLINIANLALSTVRMGMLASYSGSSWVEMYTFYSGDVRYVTDDDLRVSLVCNAFMIPQELLVLSALVIQAWSMVQLWSQPRKWAAICVSILISLASFCFKCASMAIQIRVITEPFDITPLMWVRLTEVSLMTAAIAWFCFLFNVRLVTHMWTNRSILPPTKSLSSMDVLVMANGLLMFIPVIFTVFQFFEFPLLESGSLVLTSVVLALPLAALAAQRVSAGGVPQQQRGPRDEEDNTAGNSNKRFLDDFSHPSTAGGTSRHTRRAGNLGTNVAEGPQSPGVLTRLQRRTDPIDLELQRIDDDPSNDDGGHPQERSAGGVGVDRSIERREERI